MCDILIDLHIIFCADLKIINIGLLQIILKCHHRRVNVLLATKTCPGPNKTVCNKIKHERSLKIVYLINYCMGNYCYKREECTSYLLHAARTAKDQLFQL